VIADTSGLIAYFNAADPHHAAVVAVIDRLTEPMTVSPFVIAELDDLIMSRLGVDVELAVLAQLHSGAVDIAPCDRAGLAESRDVIAKYRDQSIGVGFAHQVVVARQLGVRDILTLDRRHFEVVRPLQGGRFRLHPAIR
jgi:hypothetical protein